MSKRPLDDTDRKQGTCEKELRGIPDYVGRDGTHVLRYNDSDIVHARALDRIEALLSNAQPVKQDRETAEMEIQLSASSAACESLRQENERLKRINKSLEDKLADTERDLLRVDSKLVETQDRFNRKQADFNALRQKQDIRIEVLTINLGQTKSRCDYLTKENRRLELLSGSEFFHRLMTSAKDLVENLRELGPTVSHDWTDVLIERLDSTLKECESWRQQYDDNGALRKEGDNGSQSR